jgi:predicted RNase H-like HicB family nuclease
MDREKRMRYTVFLQRRPDGIYQGLVPAIPGINGSGETREAAIQALAQAIHDALETGEFVSLELPNHVSAESNPWLATAGIFADDETLEPMLREIYAARDAE